MTYKEMAVLSQLTAAHVVQWQQTPIFRTYFLALIHRFLYFALRIKPK